MDVVAATDVLGAPDHGPYNAILVSAGAPSVPPSLIAQLKPEGRLVIPIGDRLGQMLTLVRLSGGRRITRRLTECRFVPLLGAEAWPENFWDGLPLMPAPNP